MTSATGIPPKPDYEPDVHTKGSHRRPTRTLKGDIKKLKEKTTSAKEKWTEGRKESKGKQDKVRKDAKEIIEPVKEKISERVAEEKELAEKVIEPVGKAVIAIQKALDPANGKTRPYVTSFMVSSVVSWVASPKIFVATYERIKYGTSSTDWGFMMGPGRWFRDTVGMAHETGQMKGLIWAAILGLAPMFITSVRNYSANYLAASTYRGRMAEWAVQWLTRLVYLVPVIFFVGVSYPGVVSAIFGSPWIFQWWHFWVAGLFCMTYYCTMWVFDRVEKGNALGYTHVLLMTPLASVVTGALLYTPGAAW